jgi:hypothetical protein
MGMALTTPVLAAAPSAAQQAEFDKVCLKNSGGNKSLCDCKSAQVVKLVDADFMKVVLSTMEGKSLPVDDSKAYAIYISKSNAVCAPGM